MKQSNPFATSSKQRSASPRAMTFLRKIVQLFKALATSGPPLQDPYPEPLGASFLVSLLVGKTEGKNKSPDTLLPGSQLCDCIKSRVKSQEIPLSLDPPQKVLDKPQSVFWSALASSSFAHQCIKYTNSSSHHLPSFISVSECFSRCLLEKVIKRT